MASITSHYGLQRLVAGDAFSLDGYKYTDADREQIDRLLYLGAEGHHHTGVAAAANNPLVGPTLTLITTSGNLPAGQRVYYKTTLVDINGSESAPSPEVFVDTPAAILAPGTPFLTTSGTGGVLQPGNYFYVLTAYKNTNTTETTAINIGFVSVPATTGTNRNTITFPSLPAGATGFNIYRRGPGDANFLWLTNVNMSVATPPSTYIDTGALLADCNRRTPVENSTNASNSVQLCQPGATPVTPVGYTWKIYRTTIVNNYENSLLHWVVENTFEGSGVIVPCYTDTGGATTFGKPPVTTQVTGNPSKIDLATETTGTLPLGLGAHPQIITFNFTGQLIAMQGVTMWVCEFPAATILSCRAAVGAAPSTTPVIVNVRKGLSSATPSFSTIYTTTANRPTVQVGQKRGLATYPNIKTLSYGDCLIADIDQAGGGGTPTDRDLTVNVYLIAHGFPTGTAFVPGTTTGTGN